jgi:hypothetical protein
VQLLTQDVSVAVFVLSANMRLCTTSLRQHALYDSKATAAVAVAVVNSVLAAV